jgi:hypothetical protein
LSTGPRGGAATCREGRARRRRHAACRHAPDQAQHGKTRYGTGPHGPHDRGHAGRLPTADLDDLIEILADPEHEEHQERLEWLGLDSAGRFDPAAFDLAQANDALSRLIKPPSR